MARARAKSVHATGAAGHGFGTLPVFLAAFSTILGAIMFLRFGYAVAHVGMLGALGIIVLAHLVTVPTAMAISEIATNRKVEGGGAYYIISRSFGIRIGAAIGVSLYLSQAISIAFYLIAFAEAFWPLAPWFQSVTGIAFDARFVSIPSSLALIVLIMTKGADLGVRVLYIVVATLLVSLVLFFLGDPIEGTPASLPLTASIEDPDQFFMVFAICFPAFTGMTAGVGLSGDLAKPSRSIPLGTMTATIAGGLVYAAIVVKLAMSAPPEALANDQLVMSRIAIWGPIIPIGLGCATLSSAIGSILVAPRTLQALGKDGCFPLSVTNRVLAAGSGASNEPRNATIVTSVLALAVVALGNVDFVARIISMFFMVTYGALCAISFLEHFAANPSYRPSFRSRWYLSLLGATMCLLMMFQMDPVYTVLSIFAMLGMYALTRYTPAGKGSDDLAAIFRGVMAQATRRLQVRLQRTRRRGIDAAGWRPSIVMLSGRTFGGNRSPLDLLGWLCRRYGFGTYLHHIQGHLNEETYQESERLEAELVQMAEKDLPGVFVDTLVSPSLRSALAQTLQVPGVSGMENNTVMFEMTSRDDQKTVAEVVGEAIFTCVTHKNVLILRHGDRRFGYKRSIHVWLTWHDEDNATLMVLRAYLVLGHPEWKKATISIFAALPPERVGEQRQRLQAMIAQGRLPISEKNIRFMPVEDGDAYRALVDSSSSAADFVIMGLTPERLRERGAEILMKHPELGDVLWVNAMEKVLIE